MFIINMLATDKLYIIIIQNFNKYMKKFIFLALLSPLINIYAQELDESFLKSLPTDVRNDIIERANSKTDANEINYRSSEFSSKLEYQEDLESLKLRLQEDLEELERRLQSDESLYKNLKGELELFGSDFFNTFQTSFMPINEPNPGSSYTLDTGDILEVQLIGQKDFNEPIEIRGDGSINIPDIGKLVLAGLTLNDASDVVKNRVNEIFIGTKAYITLDKIRDVNVLVSGNAANPGVYTLNGNSNLLQAINVAGGINEFGSYREINLIRNSKVIETLDVYDLLIKGNYNLNKRLRSGDVVFVSNVKKIITVEGAVKRPAKYEINEFENIDTVIFFANGIKRTADLSNIYLERILDTDLTSIPILSTSQFKSINPIDGDAIYIREYPYRTASIAGAVLKPGKYIMSPGDTTDDLIKKAGGFTENAYPFGAVYENNDAELINEKAKGILYEEFLDNIIAVSQQSVTQNFDMTPILGLAQEIKNSESNGRIIVDLVNENKENFFKVSDGDALLIPEKINNVYVYGEVSSEGAVIYSDNKNLNYFIEKSGGLKKFADSNSIYVLHPNGETQRYVTKRNIFESKPESDLEIYPGSVIFVPRKLDDSVNRRLATQAYVSILSSLGIAMASLSSINNN